MPDQSTAARVREARNPQEAMLAIAEALDGISSMLSEAPPKPATPDSVWGGWDIPSTHMLAGAIRGHEYQRPAVAEVPAAARPPVIAATVTEGDDSDHVEVDIAPVSLDRQIARLNFARDVLLLNEVLPDDGETDWPSVYSKGGPMWLYEGNRDLVMQYPLGTRSAMVRDIAEDDPKLADEVGRDILKLQGDDVSIGNFAPMADKDVG